MTHANTPIPKTLDLTKPLQTMEGLPVTVISTKGRGACPVLGYVGVAEKLRAWSDTGVGGAGSWQSLMNVPPPKQYRYMNVYRTADGFLQAGHWPNRSRLEADDLAADQASRSLVRVSCIKVEVVEGQWDE